MNIGLIAYSSKTGLGYQTRAFYRNIGCKKVLIVDLSFLNKMEVDNSWCKSECRIVKGIPSERVIRWFVDDLNVIFVVETPLNYHLFNYARMKNVKTVLQYNAEFLDYFRFENLPLPDVFLAPTTWKLKDVKKVLKSKNTTIKLLRVPIDIENEKLNFRRISEVKTLGHIIGKMASCDRNGSLTALDVFLKLGNKYEYVVYFQKQSEEYRGVEFCKVKEKLEKLKKVAKVGVFKDVENVKDLYNKMDLLVFPRRYGGLCLPTLEALAVGIPVIMPNISPNYDLLPKNWLVKAKKVNTFKARTDIDCYEANIDDVMRKIESVKQNIKNENKIARKIAINNSWKSLKKDYINLFKSLL